MRKALIGGVAAAVLCAGIAVAYPALAASTTVEGTLVAVSGTTLPAVLTVQSGTTTYMVNVTSTTVLLRKYNGVSALDEFGVGDLLSIRGTVTGTTIDATRIKDLSIQRKDAAQWGTIESIDATAQSFVFNPTKRGVANQTVTTTSKTTVFQGNRAGTFSDLSVGMTVKVIGLWRKSLSTIAADRILIKLTEINGTVSAIDCTANTMTVAVKHGKKTTSWSVTLKTNTVFRDRSNAVIACTAVAVNHKVGVRGLKTGTNALNALQVFDKTTKKTQHTYNGTITALDTVNKTFVIDQKKGTDFTVTTSVETIIVNDEGQVIAFADLVNGHKVQVKGSATGTTVTANLIMDKSLE